jgi:hypothetical protein
MSNFALQFADDRKSNRKHRQNDVLTDISFLLFSLLPTPENYNFFSSGDRLMSVGLVPMTPSGTGILSFLKC